MALSTVLGASRLLDRVRGALPTVRNARTVSFAQYGEDVLVHNLQPARRGTYVDVGAFHPWYLSNTYKLYLRGWSGITVEPNPDVALLFRRARPRDIHLVKGISRFSSVLTYYRFQHGVYNTFDSLRIEHTSEPVLEEMPIPCTPLQDVIDAHFPNRHIDLLSIDCEGQDLTVLQSIDWHRTRPTAVIVEDHEQFESNLCSGTPSQIRSLLTKRDYGLFTQCMYSFLYVDRRAFLRPNGETGFLLEKTQFHGDMRELAEKTSA
jgi:FkbM family methyltransferase